MLILLIRYLDDRLIEIHGCVKADNLNDVRNGPRYSYAWLIPGITITVIIINLSRV